MSEQLLKKFGFGEAANTVCLFKITAKYLRVQWLPDVLVSGLDYHPSDPRFESRQGRRKTN